MRRRARHTNSVAPPRSYFAAVGRPHDGQNFRSQLQFRSARRTMLRRHVLAAMRTERDRASDGELFTARSAPLAELGNDDAHAAACLGGRGWSRHQRRVRGRACRLRFRRGRDGRRLRRSCRRLWRLAARPPPARAVWMAESVPPTRPRLWAGDRCRCALVQTDVEAPQRTW